MVGWVWRQSFERAPRLQARSPFRLGRCCRVGLPSFCRHVRREAARGRETEPSDCLRGRAVSSSHLKAVWTGFVRVVSKEFFSKFLSRFVLSL